jgi:hypothetical protein
MRQWPKSERMEHIEVMGVITIARLVDMEHILETNEGDIEDAIERSFVYCDTYDVDPNQDHMLTYLTVISNRGKPGHYPAGKDLDVNGAGMRAGSIIVITTLLIG